MYLPGIKDGVTKKKELDTDVIELIKKILRLKSIDRDRGTYSATGVSQDEMKQPIFVNEDPEYCKHLAKFFKGDK